MSAAPHWFIIRSVRAAGERMETWLEKLGGLGFSTYYPMIRELRRVPRRRLSPAQRNSGVAIMRPATVPFLPHCVFVEDLPWRVAINDVPGVLGFISHPVGGYPILVPGSVIEQLRRREIELAGERIIPGATPAEFIFSDGDQVRVLNGPFTHYTGIVEIPPRCPIEAIDADTRLKIIIEIFGRPTPVDLTVADVVKF